MTPDPLHQNAVQLNHGWRRCGAAICVLAVFSVQAWASTAAVDEKLEALQEAQAAFFAAQQEGDFEAAAEHGATIRENLTEARALLEQANAARSRDAETLMQYATVLAFQDQSDLAAEALKRLTALHTDHVDGWLGLGEALSELGPGRWAEAVDAYQQCLELDPAPDKAIHAWAGLGGIYLQSGMAQLAREAYQRGLEIEGDDIRIEAGLAAVDVWEGNLLEATERIDALEFIPPTESQLLEQAVDRLKMARFPLPHDADAHASYARMLFRVGRIHQCLLPLRRSLQLDAEDHAQWNFLGSVLVSIGQIEEAVEAFEHSLSINAEQPRTQEILEMLQEADPGQPIEPPEALPDMPETAPLTPADPIGTPPS